MKRQITLFTAVLCSMACWSQTVIDLSGTWQFSTHDRKVFPESIVLPGTTDTNGKGAEPEWKQETTHLTRRHSFVGRAWYQREITIPKEWKKKDIYLHLERTKPTTLWIDGDSIGYCNRISTPQDYHIGQLKPGRHILTLCVDNAHGVPQQLYANSHAYTEDTQTNWNGIIGKMFLSLAPDTYQKSTDSSFSSALSGFHIQGQHFYANGHQVFLRGKHDACVWPLTGHVPMDRASWTRYYAICQQYGINHIRFHSWCPPEEAFAAADSMGIFLQPELPFWGDFKADDPVLMTFLHDEGEAILRTYGHHPSFVMMALGNELWGSIPEMKRFVDDFRKIAPEKYYTFGSNYYLGYQGVKPGMDYFTTCRVGGEAWGAYNTHTRGSFSFADAFEGGMINHFHPNSMMDFTEACNRAHSDENGRNVPVISHETGQFQTYPDYDEIDKYKGVLVPYNFEVFRQRLQEAGMAAQAKAFHHASGRWSLQLYKADIEMDLRTRNMAGFQLLDIQDYPGQGSAFVGILDAFMDSKGITSTNEWRQFCAPVVALVKLPKYCYRSGEDIPFSVEIANYGGSSLKGQPVTIALKKENGEVIAQQESTVNTDEEGLIAIHQDCFNEDIVNQATRMTLTVSVGQTGQPIATNSYPLWIYPETADDKKGIVETHKMTDEIVAQLEKGSKVLWTPDSTDFAENTVGGLFQTDYWNYRMFKTICEGNKKTVSPGTLGILTDGSHPIFNNFPTDDFTSWQWFAVMKNSRPMILDNLPQGYLPIVQVIDNVERNHKLGIIMEFSVGKGKLLLCMTNFSKAKEYTEGRAFYHSILRYMQSNAFAPKVIFSFADLQKALTAKPHELKIKELNNISPY